MSHTNGIVSMDPDNLREIDGVAFDLDSYTRHCAPPEDQAQAAQNPPEAAPAPVFPTDPVHLGWYEAEAEQPRVPIMGGCLPPDPEVLAQNGECQIIVRHTACTGSGSGSGSYMTSYLTSYRASWRDSGSGSLFWGSGVYLAGGYGLELI